MDSDEDELQELRAARARQTGQASLSQLRARSKVEASAHNDANENRAVGSFQNGGSSYMADDAEDEEIDDPTAVMEEEIIEANDLRNQFPQAFGEQEKEAINLEKVHEATVRQVDNATDASQDVDIGPSIALMNAPENVDDDAMVGPVLESEVEDEDPFNLPISHEVTLEGHGKGISCMDLDYTGSRLLSGSRDNTLRIFDFNGMKSTMKSFRKLEPSEGHPMLAASWSPTGDAFLAVSGSSQIKIYDRDGLERGESLRGDMYIRDQRNTKGHVYPATGGQWHPTDRSTAMTSSEDGTIRLWDTAEVTQKTVIKPMLRKTGRTNVSVCAYNNDGGSIAAGLADGSLHIWDAKGTKGRAAAIEAVPVPRAQMVKKQDWRYVSGQATLFNYGTHPPDTDVTGLAFSQDNLTLLSRAADDTLKVWDLRKFKVPVHVYEDLPNLMSTTSVCYAPDERLIITGTSALKDGTGGSLVFIDPVRHEIVRRVAMPQSVVAVKWHPRLNQIFVGTGDRSQGAVKVLYSTSLSERGVLFCAHRKPRAKDPFDFQAPLVIHNPHALPMFREEKTNKRHLDGRTKDANERLKPDVGTTALRGQSGTGGEIGSTNGTLLTQFVLKNHGKLNNPKDEDIRAKILRHEGAEDKKSKLFSRAYEKTQPVRILAKEEEDEQNKK